MPNVTGVAYNYDGSKIAASYIGNTVYMFDTADDRYGCIHSLEHKWDLGQNSYDQHYIGHKNFETIKSVNFFGPRSEYIVTGSDCGRIFLYEMYSGAVVNAFPADKHVVNCITVCFHLFKISHNNSNF